MNYLKDEKTAAVVVAEVAMSKNVRINFVYELKR